MITILAAVFYAFGIGCAVLIVGAILIEYARSRPWSLNVTHHLCGCMGPEGDEDEIERDPDAPKAEGKGPDVRAN
jgi:hypothetical protein